MRRRIRTARMLTSGASWLALVVSLMRAAPRHAFSPSASSPLFVGPSFRSFERSSLSLSKAPSWRRQRSSLDGVITTTSRCSDSIHHTHVPVKRRRQSALSASSSDSDGGESTTVANGADGKDDIITQLQEENKSLHERLRLLQIQNDELAKQQQTQRDVPPYEQRLILEDFEGEGVPAVDARGGVVDGWDPRGKRYTEPWDGDYGEFAPPVTSQSGGGEYDGLGLSSTSNLSSEAEDEICEYDDASDKWTRGGLGECPVEPDVTFLDALRSRAAWLVGLLVLQSCSGFILSRNELLLQDHPVIVYFLTMLVGAGGNAGNQASVRVIRGLALGTLNQRTQNRFLSRELRMAFALSAILSVAGFLRAIAFRTPFAETLAVTSALSMIVFSSICLGAVLPLLLQRLGVDPAHSSTSIQVVMDILGVVLTVFVSTLVLDSGWGKALIGILASKLGL